MKVAAGGRAAKSQRKGERMKLKTGLCAIIITIFSGMAFAGSMVNPQLMGNSQFVKSLAEGKTISAAANPRTEISHLNFAQLSSLEYLINQTFLSYELLPYLQPVSEEEAPVVVTATALRAGLTNYAKALANKKELTGTNAQIHEAFGKVPAILNKIQNSSDEVYEELIPVLEQLTQSIKANQTKIPASNDQLDDETAVALLASFCTYKAITEGDLTGRVMQIIQQELQAGLQSMMGAE